MEKLKDNKKYFSINIFDRNGNKLLNGRIIAIYKLNIINEKELDKIEARFDKMLEEALKNYLKYNENNKLDSINKKLLQDRREF
ncbi:MAG: hypothetical protein K0R54_808 [Clostridiaceae bacterium]|jgi:hypothetical protein|nr:hypothetical protein [Clostridiaceae bacterium]